MDIHLNFVNDSNDANNSDIVIFQKNDSSDSIESAIAWHVIRNCSRGNNHPFVFSEELGVSAMDGFGNHTPQLSSGIGRAYAAIVTPAGNRLSILGDTTDRTDVEMLNALPQGSISACVFRGGNLLAKRTSLAPQRTARFQFRPTIWIGAVSEIDEGDVMNSAVLAGINTELSLVGVASADIVMTGGGAGKGSEPLSFTLQNVQIE